MKSQYIIILTTIISLAASMLLLAWIENNQRINNQDFWSVYFVDPFGENNNFIIDNNTPETKAFHYEVIKDENIIQSGDIDLDKNKQTQIDTEHNIQPIIIKVTLDKKEKVIDKK